MNLKLITYSLFFILFTSCENELSFEDKNRSSLLAINGFLEADEAENRIYLGLTGKEYVREIKDGKVEIYVNGQLRETATYQAPSEEHAYTSNIGYYPVKTHFQAGDQVKIQATKGDLSASAEGIIPSTIPIQQVDTASYLYRGNGWQEFRMRVKVTFTDPSETKDYYRLAIADQGKEYKGESFSEWSEECPLVTNEDIVLTEGSPTSGEVENNLGVFGSQENQYAVFDDSRLQGTYTMTVSVRYVLLREGYGDEYGWRRTDDWVSYLKIRLESISEAQYYYLRALNLYRSDNYDEVLSQPVQFPSNVEGGTGIIGLSNGEYIIMKRQKEKKQELPVR